jgi:hypothetical protein
MSGEFKVYFKSIQNPSQDRPSPIWGGLRIDFKSVFNSTKGEECLEDGGFCRKWLENGPFIGGGKLVKLVCGIQDGCLRILCQFPNVSGGKVKEMVGSRR